MTARWSRWGAASGIIAGLLCAPIGLIVPQLPDLGSSAAIERFYRTHETLLKAVILLASCGFFFLLCFLGALVERLRRAEGTGPLAWIAFGGGLLFTTSLNIAIGLVATAGLLSDAGAPRDHLRPAHRRVRPRGAGRAGRRGVLRRHRRAGVCHHGPLALVGRGERDRGAGEPLEAGMQYRVFRRQRRMPEESSIHGMNG